MAEIIDYDDTLLPEEFKIAEVTKEYVTSLRRSPSITVHTDNYRHHMETFSPYLNIDKNGVRYTPADSVSEFIYMFGGSNFYGYCLEDKHTLPYFIQYVFDGRYKVLNYSKCANDILNMYFTILSANPKNSMVILETGLYLQLSEFGDYKYDLKTYVKLSPNFINYIFHKIYMFLYKNGNTVYCLDTNNAKEAMCPNITNTIYHPEEIKKYKLTDNTGINHLNATGNYLFSLYLKNMLIEENRSVSLYDMSNITNEDNESFSQLVKKHSDINFKLLRQKEEFKSNFKRFEPYRVESSKTKGIIFLTANPFTIGHQKLIEYAASKVDILYLSSLISSKFYFSYEERQKMILMGTQHLNNVIYIPPTEIEHSSITFNAYIYKDESARDITSFKMDENLFDFENGCEISIMIMKILGITHRFFGEEPYDVITNKYLKDFSKLCETKYKWITTDIVPRIEAHHKEISGTYCRKLLEKKSKELKEFVPEIIYNYLMNIKICI